MRWPVRARGKTKNEDEVNDIHAGYRIYYRLELVRGYHLFAFPFFFPPPLGRSPALSASHFLRLSSPMDTPATSRILHN